MNERRHKQISKFLSLILRHQPEKIGLSLEKDGWANAADLLANAKRSGFAFSLEELQTVVAENDKKRFAFDANGERIRASQGHSVSVEIEFEKQTPPAILFHGTAEKNVKSILENGLTKMRRHHVHLSSDTETARKVGTRHGKSVIFEIDAAKMLENNFAFYLSANKVWLIEAVPPQFLRLIDYES